MTLTKPQKEALRTLADGELHETSASSRASTLNRQTAQFLVRQGWATRHFILPDGREISATARDEHSPYEWRLKYRITDGGRTILKAIFGWER